MTTAPLSIGRARSAVRDVYLYHPAVDLLFACGGWLVILTAINYWMSGGVVPATNEAVPAPLRALALVGTYVIAQPHQAATFFKLYGERESRTKHVLVARVLPILLVGYVILAMFSNRVAMAGTTLYIALALHHIMAQCRGVALMYCARGGVQLAQDEKLLLHVMLWTAVSGAVLQQLSPDFPRQAFLGIGLFKLEQFAAMPAWLFQGVAASCMVSLLYLQGRRLVHHQPVMPLPAVLTLLTALTLLTIWNNAGELAWIFVPPFFHGSQYLCVAMTYFLKKEKSQQPAASKSALGEFAAVRLTELFAVGLMLFVGLPMLLSFSAVPFSVCSAVIFFAISFHHFAADACIWKLRDPNVRRNLSS